MRAESALDKVSILPRNTVVTMDNTGYELDLLRDDGDFSLCRAKQLDNPVSVSALVASSFAPRSVARLEHEHALAPLLGHR